MKKRILALALCLVMAVSLLPITAAAYDGNFLTSAHVTGSGFEKGADDAYVLKEDSWTVEVNDSDATGKFTGSTVGLYRDAALTMPVTEDPAGGGTFYLKYVLITNMDDTGWDDNPNCSLTIPGYSTAYLSRDFSLVVQAGKIQTYYFYITFQVTKTHEHRWQFGQTGNSLTATCSAPNCPYGEVGVTLTAHSVTLPESPFNAKWESTADFKEAFPNAQIYGPYYFYNESNGFTQVDPNTFTPKAGEYQAQVYIYGLPGNEVAESGAFSTDDGTELGGGHLDLWIDYTAVDPAVTAQTGDNRPIELMMISAAVFSALAAAAFFLDSKRRNASL